MKKLTFVLLSQLLFAVSFSQTLKKYSVGDSKCTVGFYCDPGRFEVSYSQDSTKSYNAQCVNDDISYGIVCVQLAEETPDMNAAEEMLISYMDFLKMTYNIASAVGYKQGYKLKDNENTRGISDDWTDAQKSNWKVKGWTNGKYMAVLFAHGKKAFPDSEVNTFLEAFAFPAN